jgi:hypothetical protein
VPEPGVFSFLTRVTELVTFVWKRKAQKNDLPETKDEQARNAIHREVAKDDEAAANVRIADSLFRLRMRKNAHDKQRPAGPKDEGK